MKIKDKVRRGEEGFTLVELLVVVAILAILVAIVMANFTGLLSGAKSTSNAAELNIVQTAVDVRMANESLTSYPNTGTSNDMRRFRLYPNYMRERYSNCRYRVVASGVVTQTSCP